MSSNIQSPKETFLTVEGMSCASCVRHVEGALRSIDGILDVAVSLGEGKVRVRHDADRATIQQMLDALGEAGYESRPNEV